MAVFWLIDWSIESFSFSYFCSNTLYILQFSLYSFCSVSVPKFVFVLVLVDECIILVLIIILFIKKTSLLPGTYIVHCIWFHVVLSLCRLTEYFMPVQYYIFTFLIYFYARQHVALTSYHTSVCLSVRQSRPGTDSSQGEIETPGFCHMTV